MEPFDSSHPHSTFPQTNDPESVPSSSTYSLGNEHSPYIPYYNSPRQNMAIRRNNQNRQSEEIPVLYAFEDSPDMQYTATTTPSTGKQKKCEPFLNPSRLAILSSFLSLLSSAASFIGVIAVSEDFATGEETGLSTTEEGEEFFEQLAFVDLARSQSAPEPLNQLDSTARDMQNVLYHIQELRKRL